MGWSGGVYSRVHNWVADALAAINIEAVRMDEEDDSIATGLNNCITKDGTNSPSADLPMATRKHTNVSSPTARSQYLDVNTFQDGEPLWGGTSGGDADDFTLALSPVITSYVTGMLVRWNPHADCNVGATINIDTIGARDLYVNGREIRAGEIKSIGYYEMIYDGVDFHIIGAAPMDAVNRGDFITMGQVVDGDGVWCGSSAGTSAAYTLNPEPNVEAYVAGMSLKFKAHLDCSDDATINVDGTGAKDLYVNGRSIKADEILIDRLYEIVYDGTVFHVFGQSPVAGQGRDNFLSVGQAQDGFPVWGGLTSGTGDHYTLALTPTLTAYVAGMIVRIKPNLNSNAGADIEIDGLGQKDIFFGGTYISNDTMLNTAVYDLVYDGTRFHVIGVSELNAHGCSVYSTSDTTITNGNNSSIECQAERYDTDSLHSMTTSKERISIPSDLNGLWNVSAVLWIDPAGSAGGAIRCTIFDEIGNEIGAVWLAPTTTQSMQINMAGDFEAENTNNYFYIDVDNQSGVSIDIGVFRFSAHFVGRID